MISACAVIGITIFSTHGEILRLAGPAGLVIADVYVMITTICVMECIGEFVIMWPVSNAMIEYVRAFVDEDLALVVGLAYWSVGAVQKCLSGLIAKCLIQVHHVFGFCYSYWRCSKSVCTFSSR